MHGPDSDAALMRAAVIVLFVLMALILRARTMRRSSKPAVARGAGDGSQPGDLLRRALGQSSDQARAPRGGQPLTPERFQISEPFQQVQQAPKIGPESAFVPSFLLLALFVCLCAMAYRYLAR